MRRHLAALCGCLLLAAAGARAQDLQEEGPMRVMDARGETRPFEWLEFFAASRGFRLDGSQPAYDLEGGAALDLGGGLAVTGGYRVLGLGWIGSDPPEPSAAPVLGLRLSF